MLQYEFLYSSIAKKAKSSMIRELLKVIDDKEIISFAGGIPDYRYFPKQEILEITDYLINTKPEICLQYTSTEGISDLRWEICKWFTGKVVLDKDNILITTSSQQGLDILAKTFINKGDIIILEKPSYIGALQAFANYEADMVGIELDDEGLNPAKLQEVIDRLKKEGKKERIKFLYIIPDFQNPSGITLSLKRRKEILEICKKEEILIVEDSPYREINFKNESLPLLFELSKGEGVILLLTFSKIFVPGLRLGVIVGDSQLIQKFVVLKQSLDLCTPALSQCIASEFLKRGYLEKHLKKIIEVYKLKKQVMIESLQTEFSDLNVKYNNPDGGLFLFFYLPDGYDALEMFNLAIKNKIAYVPGTAFYCDNTGKNTIRLNFSFPTHEQIREGVKRLKVTVKQYLSTKDM